MSAAVNTGRRDLLGASAAFLLIGAGGPTQAANHPDAALLALCAEFEVLQRRQNGLWSWFVDGKSCHGINYIPDEKVRDRAHKLLEDEIWPLHLGIYEARATTIEGLRAKARCLLLAEIDMRKVAADQEDDIGLDAVTTNLLGTLLRDLAGDTVTQATCADGPLTHDTSAMEA